MEKRSLKIENPVEDCANSLSNLKSVRDKLKLRLKCANIELIEIVKKTEKTNKMSERLLKRFLLERSGRPRTLPLAECLEETRRIRSVIVPAMRGLIQTLSNSNDWLKGIKRNLQELLQQKSIEREINVEESQIETHKLDPGQGSVEESYVELTQNGGLEEKVPRHVSNANII